MNNDYLNMLSLESLLRLGKLDFRSKEGKEIKKKIGIQSSQIIKKRIKVLLKDKEKLGPPRYFHIVPDLIERVIKIQSICRKYIIISKLNYFGPCYFDFSLSNNSFDFFTYQDIKLIPIQYLISYKDKDNFVYTFDIRSLSKLFESESNENPFNRQPFPEKVIKIVSKRISNLEPNANEDNSKSRKRRKKTVEKHLDVKTRAVDLFQKMDKLDQYTNVSWFCDLSIKQLKNFYRFLEDIWNYRTQITPEQKKRISKNGDVCSIPITHILKIKKISEIQDIILDQIELLITGGETRDDKILGCLYVLTALAETSPKIAECLPWLINP